MPEVPIGWTIKFLAFEKCQCCSRIYYLFFKASHPKLPVMGASAFYSKQDAFEAINLLKQEGNLIEEEHTFLGTQIAQSALPEAAIPHDQAVRISTKHENNPMTYQGVMTTIMLLAHEPDDTKPAH